MVWVVLLAVAVALVAALAWLLLTRQQSIATGRRGAQDARHNGDAPTTE